MAELKIRVAGYRRASVNSEWETHVIDKTLHDVLSGNIDGFTIDKYRIDSFDPSVIVIHDTFNWDLIPAGTELSITDMEAGKYTLEYYHGVASNSDIFFTALGQAKYQIRLTIISIV